MKMAKGELKRRKDATRRAAKEELLKSGIVQFRVESSVLEDLYELAESKRVRMGGMVRQWVLDRLSREKNGSAQDQKSQSFVAKAAADYTVDRSAKSQSGSRDLSKRVSALEKLIDDLLSAEKQAAMKPARVLYGSGILVGDLEEATKDISRLVKKSVSKTVADI